MISDRQQALLRFIIEQYINTVEPVSSKTVVEHGSFDVSAPTVRNDMRDLEEKGYLTHPHTSAGRIPTEVGYQHYIDELMEAEEAKEEVKQLIERVVSETEEFERKVKLLGKLVSEYSKQAVIISFPSDTIYYTGIGNVFSQPEFRNYAHTVNMSQIFDQCEERIDDIAAHAKGNEISILIGKNNPLGNTSSMIVTRLPNETIFTTLGPLRMDYKRTIGVFTYINNVLS